MVTNKDESIMVFKTSRKTLFFEHKWFQTGALCYSTLAPQQKNLLDNQFQSLSKRYWFSIYKIEIHLMRQVWSCFKKAIEFTFNHFIFILWHLFQIHISKQIVLNATDYLLLWMNWTRVICTNQLTGNNSSSKTPRGIIWSPHAEMRLGNDTNCSPHKIAIVDISLAVHHQCCSHVTLK